MFHCNYINWSEIRNEFKKLNCSTCKNKGIPKGCKGNGSCLTNGCNQRSVYNWLSDFDTLQPAQQNVVELSFKNGRKDFGLNVQENAVHGSDSNENAQKEIAFFFTDSELLSS